MRKGLVIFLLVAGCFNGFSQDLSNDQARPDFQNQVGINATNFIRSFISFSNTAPVTTNNVPVFMVNYKGLFSGKLLPQQFRYGFRLGGNIANTETDNSTETTFNNNKVTDYAWRVGIEVQQELSKRWVLYYGLDYFMSNDNNETHTLTNVGGAPGSEVFLDVKTTQSQKASGFGPVLGIQFNINRYLCLSTETSLYLITGTTSLENIQSLSDGTPITQQPADKGSIKQQSIALPAFINFSVMF